MDKKIGLFSLFAFLNAGSPKETNQLDWMHAEANMDFVSSFNWFCFWFKFSILSFLHCQVIIINSFMSNILNIEHHNYTSNLKLKNYN